MKTTDREHFQTIGYYLCEIVEVPEWLHGPDRQMLSVSGCIGEQHPRWECFMGGWDKEALQKYQEKLWLNKERYRELSETAKPILFDLKSQHIPVKPDHCGHVLYKYSESFQFHLFYLPFCTLLTGLAAASAYRSSPYNPPDTEYVHGLRHCYACKYSRFSRIILEKKRHIIRVHRHVPWPVKLSWNDIF